MSSKVQCSRRWQDLIGSKAKVQVQGETQEGTEIDEDSATACDTVKRK